MECPNCGFDLGEGMLPARCPECGHNLANATDAPDLEEGARRAAEVRGRVRGISEFASSAPTEARRGLGPRFLLALAIVAAFVGVIGVCAWQLQLVGGTAPTDVTGWRYERAQQELERKGFSVEATRELSDDPEGFVTAMDPRPSSRIEKGSKITLTVTQSRRMPDIVGKKLEEAEALMGDQGLTFKVSERADDGEEGLVLAASAQKDDVLTSQDEVTLYVSRSRAVPDVVGKTQEDAEKAIKAEGLVPKVVYVEAGKDQKEGTVVATDPTKGTKLKKDDTVTISVARAYVKKIEEQAKKALEVVYNADPGTNGATIGAALKPLLSSSLTISGNPASGVSDVTVYQVLVKGNHSLPAGVDKNLDYLPRSIVSIDSVQGNSDGTVNCTVTVSWDWSKLGTGYEGVVSTDTHSVMIRFDKQGGITWFEDPAADVPAYKLE